MNKVRNDFKVTKRVNFTNNDGDRWLVKAGGILIAQYQTEAEAIEAATRLNEDPWYFDRKNRHS